MNLQEINKTKTSILKLLGDNCVYAALLKLKMLIDATADYTLREQYQQQKTAYDSLLQYVVAGAQDTGREKILQDITQSIYTLTDLCVIALSCNQSYELFYTRWATHSRGTIGEIVSKYDNLAKRSQLLQAAPASRLNQQALAEVKRAAEMTETDMFDQVWTRFPLSAVDCAAVSSVFTSQQVPGFFKGLLISALLLGSTKFYDPSKLNLLLDIYINSDNDDLQIRALTAAIIIIYQYHTRLLGNHQLEARLRLLDDCAHFRNDVMSILRRLIYSRNTENISKRMREELMPNLMKINPDLLNKLKGKSGIVDPSELEDNPEWADWLEKSGITKKMEELQELQFEGGDVFVSTFSHLKGYPFFNIMANWFMPYHDSHSSIDSTFGPGESPLRKVIADAPFLCDSDKYSFAFSMGSVPEMQRKMMMSQFDAQNASLKEMTSAELPDDKKRQRDMLANRYIQDLYRFFKLFSRRAEFKSIFDSSMDFLQIPFLRHILDDKLNLGVIAEFYMKNGFYDDAIGYYGRILEVDHNVTPQVLQKIGFAHQNLGHFAEAIDFYKRYEIVNDHDTWTLRHIATCYRALRDTGNALVYYKKAEKLAPDNASLCLNIGHCLLEQGKTNDALNYYFKVDYLAPEKHKAWRPIAWCSFAVGNFEQSENYYKKIIESGEDEVQDHLNYGHVLLCSHRAAEALSQYRTALVMEKGDKVDAFTHDFDADAHYLVEKGLDWHYITLMREAVISRQFKQQ